MESTIKYAKQLIKHSKITKISDTLFNVDGYSIKLQRKKGRLILLCSCENSSLFADNNFCRHKFALITYLSDKDFLSRLDKLILEYQNYKDLNMQVSMDCFIGDLNSIKEKW